MASLSIPSPHKISDTQFIGDLMVLFERRKVKCGDASSFDSFTSELASNNKLRGDLFALCTAISHMASEDLSGEELLVLVARALSGTGAAKGAPLPEIPASMRKAFLDGWEAWGNRNSFAMEEPATWPPPRKQQMGEVAEPFATGDREPTEPQEKDPAEGTRTIQEALEIARERSPNGVLGPRFDEQRTPNHAPPNIEHMTISELKKLLEDIENRVKGIGPHLGQLGAAATGLAEVVSRDTSIPRRVVLNFESDHSAPPDIAASALPASSEFDEDAFLKRHAYLKPTTREEIAAASLSHFAAGKDEAPVVPPVVAAKVPVADVPLVDTPMVVPPIRVTSETVSPKPPMEFLAGYQQPQISSRAKAGVVLAFAFFFLMAFTLGGIYVYRSLHPKTIFDYSEFKPAVPSVSQPPDPQVTVPAPEAAHANPKVSSNPNAHTARGDVKGTARSRTAVPQVPAASVWPPSNQSTRDVAVQEVASAQEAAASRRTAPVHVEPTSNGSSTTIVGFAPKPVHADANGVSGTVMVEVSISKQGNVTSARVISGPQALRSAAVQTVQQWKFKPYMVDGAPAEVTTTLGVYVKGD